MPDRLITRQLFLPCPAEPTQQLIAWIEHLPEGISEMAFHPGYADPQVIDPPKFAGARELDTALVTAPEVVAAVKRHGVELISFAQL